MSRKGQVAGFILWILAAGTALLSIPGPARAAGGDCEDSFLTANQLIANNPPDYANAIDLYNDVLKNCPNFRQADLVAFNLGSAYLHINPPQYDKAISILENGVAQFPKSTQFLRIQTALGIAYIAQADHLSATSHDQAVPFYKKAIDVLTQVQDKQTETDLKAQVAFDLGNARFEVGDYAAAIETYQALLAQKPDKSVAAPAMYNLGNACMNLANAEKDPAKRAQSYKDASDAFKTLIDKYPDDPNANDARLQMAKVAYQQKDPNTARPLLRQLMASDNKNVSAEATNYLAFSYVDTKEYAEALPLLQKYVQNFGGMPEADNARVEIGYILRTQNKDLTGALAMYRTAAGSANERTSQSAQEGELAVAAQYVQAKDYASALAIYVSLNNSTVDSVKEDAAYGRALVLVGGKDPQAANALADYLKAYPEGPGSANAAYQLGVIDYNKPDYPAAMQAFAQAGHSKIDPSATPDQQKESARLRTESLYWAGQAASQAKQDDQASQYWQEEVQSDPGYTSDRTAEALVSLGSYYTAHNQADKASSYFKQALDNFPQSSAPADTLLDLGNQAIGDHQFDQAIGVYQMIIAARPNSTAGASAQFNLGIAYSQCAPPQVDNALKAFQGYLKANPKGKLADKAALNAGLAAESLADAGTGADQTASLKQARGYFQQAGMLTTDKNLASHVAWKIAAVDGKLAAATANAEQVTSAIGELDAAIAKYPASPDLENMYFEKGHIYQVAARSAKENAQARTFEKDAIASFQDFLTRYPKSVNGPAAHFNLAVMQYNQAAAESDKAATLTAAAAAAAHKSARTLYARAVDDFQASLAGAAPAVPLDLAYFYQGWACINSNQQERGIAAFRALLKDYPDSPNAPAAAGRIGILEAQTNPDEAIGLIQQFLNSKPSDADAAVANLALARAYLKKGSPDQAMTALGLVIAAPRSAVALATLAEAFYTRGQIYLAKGDKDAARREFLFVKVQCKGQADWVMKANTALDAARAFLGKRGRAGAVVTRRKIRRQTVWFKRRRQWR
jgi:tetratricopeptide (TPR) repeat protein